MNQDLRADNHRLTNELSRSSAQLQQLHRDSEREQSLRVAESEEQISQLKQQLTERTEQLSQVRHERQMLLGAVREHSRRGGEAAELGPRTLPRGQSATQGAQSARRGEQHASTDDRFRGKERNNQTDTSDPYRKRLDEMAALTKDLIGEEL